MLPSARIPHAHKMAAEAATIIVKFQVAEGRSGKGAKGYMPQLYNFKLCEFEQVTELLNASVSILIRYE